MTRALVTSIAALMLTACQGTTTAPASGSAALAGNCHGTSEPTIVRYRSRDTLGLEHAVHLLNRGDGGLRRAGCEDPAPLASIVTLRYRVAGT